MDNSKKRKDFQSLLRCLIVFLLLIGGIGCSKHDNQNLDTWVGEYAYGESSQPAIPDGIGPFVGYVIFIYEEEGRYFANITADGWMLGIRAKAQVRGDENSIELVFFEYPEDSMNIYDPGDVILRFSKNKDVIITTWVNDTPLSGEEGAEGIYFQKVVE